MSEATVSTSPQLSVDDKLDKIMEAVAFQTQLIASAMIAYDKQLQANKQSKIIKV